MNVATKVILLLALLPNALASQGFLEQFSYEGLQLTGIGFEFGAVASDRLTRELTSAVRVDYGRIAPDVRVLLGVSYFEGEFNAAEISEFEAGIRRVIRDQPPGFTVDVGTVTWQDIEAALDLQYVLEAGARMTNYLGLGFAAHLRNGSGTAIDDTFVEDALDTVDAGLNFSMGTAIEIVPAIQVTLDLRGGLTSELRTATARAGLMYRIVRGG